MSDRGRQRGSREHWASDHERARQHAAERLSLPLPAAENAWLDSHLRSCAACTSVAAEYEAQRNALRGLSEPVPPRDLWARTAAALDRAERQAGHDLPSPSVFPGRGGAPGSRGARSIRGLRAERRALAYRSSPRSLPGLLADPRRARPAGGLSWVAPFGALAALAIVVVIGGTVLLNSGSRPLASPASFEPGTAQADATPIDVGAGEVAWLTPAQDGTYSINFARVDKVCPTNAQPDCAPIGVQSSPRQLATVHSVTHTVLRSPSHTQLVVVPASTKKRGGGSVIVVSVPTQAAVSPTAPSPSSPAASPAGIVAPASSAPTTAVVASGAATESPAAAGTAASTAAATEIAASAQTSQAPTSPVAASSETPAAISAAPSESPGLVPLPPSEVPGGTGPLGPAGSPAESSPAAGTPSAEASGPEPTATALAIISNVVVVGETVSYSPDGTMLAFSARPADGGQGPDIYLWRAGDPAARPVTFDHASLFSGWLGNRLLGSRVLDLAGQPAGTVEPSASDAAVPSGGAASAEAGSSGTTLPFAAGSPPSAGSPSPTESPAPSAALPSLAPTSASPSASGAGESLASRSDSALGAGTGVGGSGDLASGGSGVVAGGASTTAVAHTFILDPISGAETDLAAPAWRPAVDPSGRFVAYWAGTLRYDAATLGWLPDRGILALASWPALAGTDPNATLAPVPLLDNSSVAVPAGEWDIRWDESGTHLAFWAADVDNPELGRLTLLTIDAGGRVDPNGISLHDAPALAGFSIGDGRLAWATPPGQDGEGSRVQVLAWSGENAGKIDSQPASGNDAVVIVR